MQSRDLSFAVLVTLTSTLTACAGTVSTDDEVVGSEPQSIVSGTRAEAYPETVLIDGDKSGEPAPGCVGALIAPRAVLTSARCATRFDHSRVTTPFASGQTARGVRSAVYDFGRPAPSQTVDSSVDGWHGGAHAVDGNVDAWRGDAPAGDDDGVDRWRGDEHDVGLVFLDTPIVLSSYPELAAAPLTADDRVVTVDRAIDGAVSRTAAYVSRPFAVEVASREGFRYDYAAVDAIAHGDAGGPVFLQDTHTIVAVAAGDVHGTALLARVDLLDRWIQTEIAAAGAGEPGGLR